MPSYIIKRSPDHDEYLIWSTIVDAPTTTVGNREEVLELLAWRFPGDDSEARLERADRQGSSAYSGQYGFEHDHFIWREDAPENYGRLDYFEDGEVAMGKILTREEVFLAAKEETS